MPQNRGPAHPLNRWTLQIRITWRLSMDKTIDINKQSRCIDEPIVVLKGKTKLILTLLLVLLLNTLICIFVFIMPAIQYSEYSSPLFYLALIWICGLPYFLRSFNSKQIHFYNDRVEVYPYLLSCFTIYYNDMRVNVHGNFRVTFSKAYKTTLVTPFRLFRDKFLLTVAISLRNFLLYDKNQIDAVMDILKNKSSEYITKPLS